MSKIELAVVILLGILLCTGFLKTAASAEVKPDTIEIAENHVPDEGVMIVLRAPTRENYCLVKVYRERDGTLKEEVINGRTLSLLRNTPVFFRVDQVNTILYDIQITVEQENSPPPPQDSAKSKNNDSSSQSQPKSKNNDSPSQSQPKSKNNDSPSQSPTPPESGTSVIRILDALLAIFNVVMLVEDKSDEIQKAKNALTTLGCKLQAAKALNSELDEILYASEMPQFCGFKSIQTRAATAANETAAKLYREGKAALAAVHQVYSDAKNDGSSPVLKRFPILTELGDPSKGKAKEVLDVFVQPAKKLRMIKTAKWRKDDTQEHVLKDNITYTCVIKPAVKPPVVKLSEKYPELRRIEFVVTVNRMPDLSGRKLTFGSFLTGLHNDNGNSGERRFTESLAVLTHIPLYSYNAATLKSLKFRRHSLDSLKFLKFRGAVAISGGLGGGSITGSDGKFTLGQLPTLLGGSLLFAAPKSESLLALTVGGTLRPVKGDVTQPERALGWFFAITVSYDVWGALSDKLNPKKKE